MRILIVEDEKLTREGLANGIDWEHLGIDEVLLACDGVEGVMKAQSAPPDIVLTDVRMPHMDGIAMAEKLQEKWDGISIIFMSGYSDREYLKAAIRLKAVSYVEKPIDLEEVAQVLEDAVANVNEQRRKAEYTTYSRRLQESEIALKLTTPKPGEEILSDLQAFRVYTKEKAGSCFTMLIQCYDNMQLSQTAALAHRQVEAVIAKFRLDLVYTPRRQSLLIYHLFAPNPLADSTLWLLGEELKTRFLSANLHFHIIFGKQVDDPSGLHHSYESAVVNLQQVFFQEENTFYIYSHVSGRREFRDLSDLKTEELFADALRGRDEKTAQAVPEKMFTQVISGKDVLPGQVRDLYYRLFSTLKQSCSQHQIETPFFSATPNLMERVASAVSVYDLRDQLKQAVAEFFEMLRQRTDQPGASSMIRFYIESNYASRSLSVKAISDYMHLSPTYLCTLFKNETGTTLNQYITDYRMKKARELLSDPRNRVSEIAESVGFTDSNYFSKAFKKQFGVSPSEFRNT